MINYHQAVVGLLGEPRNVFASHEAWRPIEESLGVSLPQDYKDLIDTYAPVRVNGHLCLEHPANDFYSLGTWITETVDDFQETDWESGFSCPGYEESGPIFGSRGGIIPLACTDRGEYIFLAPGTDSDKWRILSCGRGWKDFYEHLMTFSEWLYRYLMGEDMFDPGQGVFYAGPVRLESLPIAAGDLQSEWFGPDRGI
ncbi:SMI1/KNR4 family protein [Streptomyces goshikiensis]|uniref:SMI1/KNR4 family protein n=1 Tax=Streptomyces goshikiensis TaxID=1942 RepID=UPI0036A494F2